MLSRQYKRGRQKAQFFQGSEARFLTFHERKVFSFGEIIHELNKHVAVRRLGICVTVRGNTTQERFRDTHATFLSLILIRQSQRQIMIADVSMEKLEITERGESHF
jgi:hypothetical protein